MHNSYVRKSLGKDEELLTAARIHWIVYWRVVWFLLGGIILLALPYVAARWLGGLSLVIAAVLALKAWIYAESTELAVTNHRVIAKTGFIRRNAIELLHSKVESFDVDQGIIGRIFGFGSVSVTGTGGSGEPLQFVAQPFLFRRDALACLEGAAEDNAPAVEEEAGAS